MMVRLKQSHQNFAMTQLDWTTVYMYCWTANLYLCLLVPIVYTVQYIGRFYFIILYFPVQELRWKAVCTHVHEGGVIFEKIRTLGKLCQIVIEPHFQTSARPNSAILRNHKNISDRQQSGRFRKSQKVLYSITPPYCSYYSYWILLLTIYGQ